MILPNNKNIIMAAQQAVGVADKPVSVVPTTAVPQAFAALLAYDGGEDSRGDRGGDDRGGRMACALARSRRR